MDIRSDSAIYQKTSLHHTRLIFTPAVCDFIADQNKIRELEEQASLASSTSWFSTSALETIANIACILTHIFAKTPSTFNTHRNTQIGIGNSYTQVHIHEREDARTQEQQARKRQQTNAAIGGFATAALAAERSANYLNAISELNAKIKELETIKTNFDILPGTSNRIELQLTKLIDTRLELHKKQKFNAMCKIALAVSGLVAGLVLMTGAFLAANLLAPAALALGFIGIGATFKGFYDYYDHSEELLLRKANEALNILNIENADQEDFSSSIRLPEGNHEQQADYFDGEQPAPFNQSPTGYNLQDYYPPNNLSPVYTHSHMYIPSHLIGT